MGSILLVIAVAVGTGFLLIFLIALADRKKIKETPLRPGMTRERFERICLLVLEGMKMEIDEVSRAGDSQIEILARNPTPITGGAFLVHCLYIDPAEVIGSARIIELSNMVLQERLSKGIFMTTGRFTSEIPGIGELAPIEFVDGEALQRLMEKYCPDYCVIRS